MLADVLEMNKGTANKSKGRRRILSKEEHEVKEVDRQDTDV